MRAQLDATLGIDRQMLPCPSFLCSNFGIEMLNGFCPLCHEDYHTENLVLQIENVLGSSTLIYAEFKV